MGNIKLSNEMLTLRHLITSGATTIGNITLNTEVDYEETDDIIRNEDIFILNTDDTVEVNFNMLQEIVFEQQENISNAEEDIDSSTSKSDTSKKHNKEQPNLTSKHSEKDTIDKITEVTKVYLIGKEYNKDIKSGIRTENKGESLTIVLN